MADRPGTQPPPENPRSVGWHADPFGRYEKRWWDGQAWSERTRNDKMPGIDPPGIDVAPAVIAKPAPASPIEDALLPISRPKIADRLSLFVACIVFLALVAVLVVALTTQTTT